KGGDNLYAVDPTYGGEGVQVRLQLDETSYEECARAFASLAKPDATATAAQASRGRFAISALICSAGAPSGAPPCAPNRELARRGLFPGNHAVFGLWSELWRAGSAGR